MEKTIGKSKISIKQGDITQQKTSAIVNAANSGLMGGGGVDGAIHRTGGPEILEACKKIVSKMGRLPPGKAVVTTGGKLIAQYVIHTVGPIWRGGEKREEETLRSAYQESLSLALQQGIKSISFPSISTGAYGYPVQEAARIALVAVADFLKHNPTIEEVQFVLFDSATFETYQRALEEIS